MRTDLILRVYNTNIGSSEKTQIGISVRNLISPAPEAPRSKAKVRGRSSAEIVGSNPGGGMEVCLLWALCVR